MTAEHESALVAIALRYVEAIERENRILRICVFEAQAAAHAEHAEPEKPTDGGGNGGGVN